MIYLKIHLSERGKVIAACDSELIGNIYEEGKKILDLKNYAYFYKGNLCSVEELDKELEEFYTVNLIGERSVKRAIDRNLATYKQVMKIANIPHLQIYKI